MLVMLLPALADAALDWPRMAKMLVPGLAASAPLSRWHVLPTADEYSVRSSLTT